MGRKRFSLEALVLLLAAGAIAPVAAAGVSFSRQEIGNMPQGVAVSDSRYFAASAIAQETAIASASAAPDAAPFIQYPSATGSVSTPLFSQAVDDGNALKAPTPLAFHTIQWMAFEHPETSTTSEPPQKVLRTTPRFSDNNATPIPLLTAIQSGSTCVLALSLVALLRRVRRVLR
jgi:hypothetical protein